MSILIVALVLIIIHVSRGAWPRMREAAIAGYFGVMRRGLERTGLDNTLGIAVALTLPVALVALVQWQLLQLPTTWPWFLFSLVFLGLSWGSRDLDADVDTYLEAVDEESARKAAEPLIASYRKPHPPTTREAVVKGIFYQGLVRWFGVLFWFLVLGAAGALLFRLPHAALLTDAVRERMNPRQIALCKRVVMLIDLVPAALTTLALAVVGNFDAVIEAWKSHARLRHPHALSIDYEFLPEVGFRVVAHETDSEGSFSEIHAKACKEVGQAMSLVWRAFLAWLTIVAILVLAGWVS